MLFLIQTLLIVIQLFSFILFLRIMLTWIPSESVIKITLFLGEITDPILRPFQKIIPPIAGLDLSPLLLFFLLNIFSDYLSSFFY